MVGLCPVQDPSGTVPKVGVGTASLCAVVTYCCAGGCWVHMVAPGLLGLPLPCGAASYGRAGLRAAGVTLPTLACHTWWCGPSNRCVKAGQGKGPQLLATPAWDRIPPHGAEGGRLDETGRQLPPPGQTRFLGVDLERGRRRGNTCPSSAQSSPESHGAGGGSGPWASTSDLLFLVKFRFFWKVFLHLLSAIETI